MLNCLQVRVRVRVRVRENNQGIRSKLENKVKELYTSHG
jgi:hypothetical protein